MSRLLSTIEDHAYRRGRDLAIVSDGAAIRYEQLPRLIAEAAKRLDDHRCRVIGLRLDNGPDWLLWDLACIATGTVCVPLPRFFSAEQQLHAVKAAGIDHIIDEQGMARVAGADAEARLPDGTSKITFTSGTTGTPKGVCLPQERLEEVASSLVGAVGASPDDRHLAVLPLSVLLENVAGAYATLLAGATYYVFTPARLGFERTFRPDYGRWLKTMLAEAVTSAILVPELLRGLVVVLAEDGREISSALKFLAVGGARLPNNLISRARSLGLPAYEGYGLSECGSVIAMNTPQHDEPGSAGKLLPHVAASTRDGEIVVHHPAFLGYIGKPITGPFATGDLATIDGSGHIHLHGRSRNVIITSFGRNLSPEWIESALLEQAAIAQAVVYGEGMPSLGALIVPAGRHDEVPGAISEANRRLPEYARIHRYHLVPAFTFENNLLTANGRLRRDDILGCHAPLVRSENAPDNVLRSAG